MENIKHREQKKKKKDRQIFEQPKQLLNKVSYGI